MKTCLRNLIAKVLVLLLTFAFATSGFAHRVSSPQDQQLALAAAELGVSVDDICGGTGDDHATSGTCEVCLLTAASDVPPAAFAVFDLRLATRATGPSQGTAIPATCASSANHPVRAPPFV